MNVSDVSDVVAAWAGGKRVLLCWQRGKVGTLVTGWLRADGKRAIETQEGRAIMEEGFEGFWAMGARDPIPSREQLDAQGDPDLGGIPERQCSNWSCGCPGQTAGAMHGRLTLCADCEDEERVMVAEFLGDGMRRPATIHETRVLAHEAARVLRCNAEQVVVGDVARLGPHIFGEIKRTDGTPVCLLGAEW